MNLILKAIPWATIFNYLTVAFLFVKPIVWAKVKELVADAQTRFPEKGSGADRSVWVKSEVSRLYSDLKTHKIDALVGLAVEALKQKLNT